MMNFKENWKKKNWEKYCFIENIIPICRHSWSYFI